MDHRLPPSSADRRPFVNEEKGINKEVWYQNAGYVWIPFVIVGVILAYTMLRSVPVQQARGVKDQLDIFGNKHAG